MRVKRFTEFLNENRNLKPDHAIGDTFSDNYGGFGYRTDSGEEPYTLMSYKGYHPNIHMHTGQLKITAKDGDSWIFNDGKYKASIKVWSEQVSDRQSSQMRADQRKADKENTERIAKYFSNSFSVGDTLVAREDLYIGSDKYGPLRLTRDSWMEKSRSFAKKGRKKKIKEIKKNGVILPGWKNVITFSDLEKFFVI